MLRGRGAFGPEAGYVWLRAQYVWLEAGPAWLQAQEILAEVLKRHVEAAVAAGAPVPTEPLEQWCVAFQGGWRVLVLVFGEG